MNNISITSIKSNSKLKKNGVIRKILARPWLYIMLIPGIIYFIVFKYLPMWGLLISFKNYQPYLGFFKSKWVGLMYFQQFFSDDKFLQLLRNTMYISLLNLIFFFPLPIILALMLNEVTKNYYKRFVQTLIYIPHFLSWVLIAGISYVFLTTEGGIVNQIIELLGGQPINFLLNPKLFAPLIVGQVIWKECGWGTIIFLAAISGVDVSLYESATVDGAGRLRQLWHVTLPAIRSTIIILFILRLGSFLDSGYEQIYLMINPMTRRVGEVFDTYVYDNGILQGQYSFTTVVGLFKSVVGFVLILISNKLSKKVGEEGIL